MPRIMVVGKGGREAGMVRKLLQDPENIVTCAPGNDGMVALGPGRVTLEKKVSDFKDLRKLAQERCIDLVVVGPEDPLTKGIVDEFQDNSEVPIFGPRRGATLLESSKVWCRDFLRRYGVPSPEHHVFIDHELATDYLRGKASQFVVKADGLALGKGVYVPDSEEEGKEAIYALMVQRVCGEAGKRILIEERLFGTECSFMVLVDGENVIPLLPTMDYKRVGNGNTGPMTGGMGALAPLQICDGALQHRIMEEIIIPVVKGMKAEGRAFSGLLYGGLMLTADGPKVLEFNIRFGDPESQCIFHSLNVPLYPLLYAAATGGFGKLQSEQLPAWSQKKIVCLALCAQGYPTSPQTGQVIRGLENLTGHDVYILPAGVKEGPNGQLLTDGGRVQYIMGQADSFREAHGKTLKAAQCLTYGELPPLCRTDIGRDADAA